MGQGPDGCYGSDRVPFFQGGYKTPRFHTGLNVCSDGMRGDVSAYFACRGNGKLSLDQIFGRLGFDATFLRCSSINLTVYTDMGGPECGRKRGAKSELKAYQKREKINFSAKTWAQMAVF